MRLAAQKRMGYYPIAPEVTSLVLRHLTVKGGGDELAHHILDPCAGEGVALATLGQKLGIPPSTTWAVELNATRAALIKERHPEWHVLGPCSFLATQISAHSFSLIYCNPPFDHDYGGGGREEVAFMQRAANLLCAGGVFILVCPLNQLHRRQDMVTVLDRWFQNIRYYRMPDEHRKYGEIVIFANRRKNALYGEKLPEEGELHQAFVQHAYCNEREERLIPIVGEPHYDNFSASGWKVASGLRAARRESVDQWQLPPSVGPSRWIKTELTSDEIEFELSRSPLFRQLEAMQRIPEIRRPPMSLNKGHTSLLLLTGLLDGFVPSDPPHVVRGFCTKLWKKTRTEQYETAKGSLVTKEHSLEQPNPVIRAVWPDGKIITMSQSEAEKAGEAEALREFTAAEDVIGDED